MSIKMSAARQHKDWRHTVSTIRRAVTMKIMMKLRKESNIVAV